MVSPILFVKAIALLAISFVADAADGKPSLHTFDNNAFH